jgi:hypothetical protein
MANHDIEWHDGIIEEMHIKGSGEIYVICHLYSSAKVKTRARIIFSCTNVTDVSSSIDFNALLLNRRAGNINNGRIESPRKGVEVLKLFLFVSNLMVNCYKLNSKLSNKYAGYSHFYAPTAPSLTRLLQNA